MTDTLVIKDEACGCEVSVWQAQKKFHSRHRLGIWYGGLHSQRIDWKKKTSKLQAKKTLEQLPSTKRQTLRVEATCLYVSSSSFYKRKLRYYRNLLSGACNISSSTHLLFQGIKQDGSRGTVKYFEMEETRKIRWALPCQNRRASLSRWYEERK